MPAIALRSKQCSCGRQCASHAMRCRACWRRAQLAPSRVKVLTPPAAAWVGAMIEGEGSIWPCPNVSNTEVETIATLLRLVGDGCVSYSLPNKLGKRAVWRWQLYRKRSIIALLPQVIPYLTGKRALAQALQEEVLRYYG